MAEAVFSHLLKERELDYYFNVNSFGTSSCEEDNPVYPPVAKLLRGKGYSFSHRAQTLSLADIKNADYVLVMDSMNLADITRLTRGGYAEKIFMLGHFLPQEKDIDDPWYTRDFARAYDEIYLACNNFLSFLIERHGKALNI